MPVASSITEMDSRASETLLEDFKRRSRRFRRRNRLRGNGHVAPAGPAPEHVAGEQVQLGANLNNAMNLGQDDSDEAAGVVGNGNQDESDTWSHDRIDRGREMDRLEQILLKENHQFHIHC